MNGIEALTEVTRAGFAVNSDIARLVEQAAAEHGLPRNLLWAFVLAESGGDPRAVGDGGESIGLLQLHIRGQGAGLTVAQRQDPVHNLAVGVPPIASAWRANGHLSGRERVERSAAESGHPGDPQAFKAGTGPRLTAERGVRRIADVWQTLERESPSIMGSAAVAGVPLEGASAVIDRIAGYVEQNPGRVAAGIVVGLGLLLVL